MIQRLEKQVDKEARDLRVLASVIEHQPIGIVRLSRETAIDEHKVRYSLRMLENDGLVDPTPDGAVPADDLEERVAEINEGLDRLIDSIDELRGTV